MARRKWTNPSRLTSSSTKYVDHAPNLYQFEYHPFKSTASLFLFNVSSVLHPFPLETVSNGKSYIPVPLTVPISEPMEVHSTLCAVCKRAVTVGEQDDFIPHHQSGFDLEIAAGRGCYICGTIQLSKRWRSEQSLCRSATFECYFSLRSRDHDSIRDGLVIGTRARGYCWTFQLWREPGIATLAPLMHSPTDRFRP